ncbi:glycosyltransferase family 2 protein [Piscinibacter koreensis]|uniref:Glycosyltransferase family 2 protein n=1 Tax=Piscinibacter koreensis TaxID=2742824 RepID=A0A7Y6NL73_9BURK|nr:glycosyltransferase [Schlegelella koreensis]NUZ05154.1 glycosyltransferase family 2 protein [Schlegelella koreensis]
MIAPQVSICLPLYNGERYLQECLDSVTGQTFGDVEIILIDDGSTDGTLDIAERFARLDSRVRLLRNTANLGLVGNWNRCLDVARGTWIKYVFQDDVLDPACIAALYEAAHGDALLVACERSFLFEDGTASATRDSYERHAKQIHALFAGGHLSAEALQRFAIEQFCVNPLGEPTSVMVHTRAFERFGRFNPDFVSLCDLEFWLRVGVNSGATVVPRSLASFRVHGAATSAINLAERLYRNTTLDPLLLLHEYLHAPHFAGVRSMAGRMGSPLAARFRNRKHWARATAEWARAASHGRSSQSNDLRQIARTYPALRTGHVEHMLWRASLRLRGRGAPVPESLLDTPSR